MACRHKNKLQTREQDARTKDKSAPDKMTRASLQIGIDGIGKWKLEMNNAWYILLITFSVILVIAQTQLKNYLLCDLVIIEKFSW